MAFTTVPDKATNDVFSEANWDTHMRDNLNIAVGRPIADYVATAVVASVDFTSIASSWSHLLIAFSGKVETQGSPTIRFNNDSGANYDVVGGYGQNATTAAYEILAATQLDTFTASGNSIANVAFSSLMHIAHYTNSSNHKSIAQLSCARDSTGRTTRVVSGHWRNTAAINQITFFGPAGVNFNAGTRITIYGLGA
jgi:hypothetical protein